ncbi:hypothetical protein FUA23_11515 [Neolewinella aurantiaca]|uniref:Uncharacterized protein n=1 Tax=Neolewinella aurantiaca TaxID=2602767 RepID=A0A5C7FRW9_9BACT|nr:hypothetical protein [Neolewinella aurantiaca]TXF89133.1 hypothetical protein FUA23_11515 [Neolewinella aurantiaca]
MTSLCTRDRAQMPALFPLVLLLSLFFACDPAPRDIRDYYFPARELAERGLVYVYENTGSLPGPDQEFTYCLGVAQDTALFLSVTQYDGNFSPRQQTRQEIKNDGVYIRDLMLLQTDSSGVPVPVATELLYDRAFPFYLNGMTDNAANGYRLRFQAPSNETTTTYVSLNRTVRGDTSITVLGKSYPAIVFDLAGEVSERDTELGDISPQFTGFEIYAKGLGLVEYQRVLSVGATLGGRLTERVDMDTFLERVERPAEDHSTHGH